MFIGVLFLQLLVQLLLHLPAAAAAFEPLDSVTREQK